MTFLRAGTSRLIRATAGFALLAIAPAAFTATIDARSIRAEALFRLEHPCPATGRSSGPCKGYVIDRVIPVICGGAEEPSNLRWQTLAEAREKDKWERIGCRPGRILYRPERPVVIESFALGGTTAPVEGAPLPAAGTAPPATSSSLPGSADAGEGNAPE